MIKLIAGPMATLSTQAFRYLVEKFGSCDEYYTEMINAGSLLTRGPFEKYYLLNDIAPEKIVWQLTGKEKTSMAKAARVVSALGGIGVDINMGCSAPEIVRSGAGIAWMIRPIDEAKELVREVKDAIKTENPKLRLSVKLRLGDEDFTDDKFFAFCQMLISEGVEHLVLHPRTKKEKLSRPIRYEYVERLAQMCKSQNVSIVLNGAVKDSETAKKALAACPDIDGIMISRAAAQKPWIFREIQYGLEHNIATARQLNAQPMSALTTENAGQTIATNNVATAEQLNAQPASAPTGSSKINLLTLALEFLDRLEMYQPPEFLETRMQRFFTYYCNNFSFAHYAQTKMLNSKNLDEARLALNEYIQKVPEDEYLEAPWLSE
jgi:tRNA-dihydrouridine synthase B